VALKQQTVSCVVPKLTERLGIDDKDEKMMKRKDENDWVDVWH